MNTTTKAVSTTDSTDESSLSTRFEAEEENDFNKGFFDDEKARKPKGKKIRRMRCNFDR